MTVHVSGHDCVLADGVKETTQTTGTGTYELDGAQSGSVSFVVGVGNGNKTLYRVQSGSSWEIGVGTVATGSPPTLARTEILKSSNSDNAVNWTTGTKDIFVVAPAALLDQILPRVTLSGAIATTSGNEHDYTAVPSWAEEIKVVLNRVSINGINELQLLVGDAAGLVVSGYQGTCSRLVDDTDADSELHDTYIKLTTISVAADFYHGVILLTKFSATVWFAHGVISQEDSGASFIISARVTLPTGPLDRVRLASLGTFDNGSFAVKST